MDSAAPAILVRDLHKRYGDRVAVRGIDLEVARGEVFGLLGPNGAGKTTTVEVLEGFRSRDGGIVSVLGHDPEARSPELRRRVGIVLQSAGLHRHLKVREAVEHWASLYPAPRDPAEILAAVGLTEDADRQVRKLSGGRQRRVDLALALVGDPELVFLDEPTTGFDPEAKRTAWALVRGLQERGTTVLLTTHELGEAQAVCDRVAILKDGAIIAQGAPSELSTASARSVVAWRDEHGVAQEREVEDPTGLLHQLTSAALARGEALHDLTVSRPTLEDVYLQLTREEAPQP